MEENGATDFAGVLARYYAAEGLIQGHHVHVLGHGDGWRADLPGLATKGRPPPASQQSKRGDELKIAWRYGKLDNGVSRERGSLTTRACRAACLTTELPLFQSTIRPQTLRRPNPFAMRST